MSNFPRRVTILSALGLVGAFAAIASILLVGDTFGFPGSPEYRIYENINRVMAIFIALQTCTLLGFYLQHDGALRRVGRVAFFLAVFAWIGMALGTAAEFWLYSDLPYAEANMRSVAFSVFSISSLLGGLALLILGLDLLLSRALPRYFAVILILYLAVDIVLWIMGQSIFLAPALVSLAFGGMALRGSGGAGDLPREAV
jgi:hypothetical protein